MGVPPFATACFILFLCVGQMSALVIPREEIEANQGALEEFSLNIIEDGTMFAEKVAINVEKDLEYFNVPPHNKVTEAVDYLYDFKGPDEAPPFEDKIIKHKYWIVTEQVDKSQLREEVQQFCDKFPVYRLLEVDLNATYGERTRFGRQITNMLEKLNSLTFCREYQNTPCRPEEYVFRIKVLNSKKCTYWWLSCKFNEQMKLDDCNKWHHQFNSMVCYEVHCPDATTAATSTVSHGNSNGLL
ncbi:uncharacterized protein LOC111335118 isoform X2 [Stylophora pistillata]|uniref:uncharacterized protein LOC111335118 isoform X2 n=1 Tax=Stylophora pistillata TaxID=50429 RepID=UPI000C04D172|nr:uncharacterized protein LOC111335118 isoform X2 [Stylophora pistillata]